MGLVLFGQRRLEVMEVEALPAAFGVCTPMVAADKMGWLVSPAASFGVRRGDVVAAGRWKACCARGVRGGVLVTSRVDWGSEHSSRS